MTTAKQNHQVNGVDALRRPSRFALLAISLALAAPATLAQYSVRIPSPTNGAVFLQPTNVPLHLRLPALSIQRAGANAVISWPRTHAGYRLESASTLATGSVNWQRVANNLGASQWSFTHTNSLNAGQQFFRLSLE